MHHHLLRYIIVSLLAFLLMAGSTDYALAQQKKPTTTSKSQPAKKPATSTTKKPAASTAKKPAATTTKKPAAQPSKSSASQNNKKPAAQNSKKPATQSKSSQQSSSKKGKTTSSKKKGNQMSRQAYEKQQRDLQRQIKDTENLINNNNQSVRSQNRDISIRADEIRKRKDLIRSKQSQIESIMAEEDSLQREIRVLEKTHAATKQKYADAMCHLYKWRSGYDELLFVLSANNLFEGIRRARYLRHYSDWRKAQALLLEEQRLATQEAKAALELARNDHERVMHDIDRETATLTRKQQEQQAQIDALQKRNKELQSELERDRKQVAEVEKTIQRMIAEEIRKAEEARKRAEEEAARKAKAQKAASGSGSGSSSGSKTSGKSGSSSSTKVTMPALDETGRRLSGSFASNKKRMPYPVDAGFAFVDHYGSGNGNSSIVLSSKVGAHAIAIFDGVVTGCYPSNEEWTIIVQHGNYRSVYMNLSNVTVRPGQRVSTRQQLGTLKTEPDGRRSEIRFWIYEKDHAVNPESWLKR